MVQLFKHKTATIFLITLFPSIARADFVSNFYFGGGYGRASLESSFLDGGASGKPGDFRLSKDLSANVDGTPGGSQFFLGWEFFSSHHSRIAAEYGYRKIGKFSGTIYDNSGAPVAPYWVSLSSNDLLLRISFPITERFSIFERVGRSRITVTEGGPLSFHRGRQSELLLGIPGVEYWVSRNAFVCLELVMNTFTLSSANPYNLMTYTSISIGYKI